jgi:hypothetical protein
MWSRPCELEDPMPNGPWTYMSTMYFVGVMPSRAAHLPRPRAFTLADWSKEAGA